MTLIDLIKIITAAFMFVFSITLFAGEFLLSQQDNRKRSKRDTLYVYGMIIAQFAAGLLLCR